MFFQKTQNSLILPLLARHFAVKCTYPPLNPIVAVLDANCLMGRNLALLLKQNPNISELRLYDEHQEVDRMAQDLNEIDTVVRVTPFDRNSLRQAITNVDVAISTGGCPCKPGYSQKKLFEKNADNIRNVAMFLAEFNPKAVYCMTSPPLESLIPMVAEEYKKTDRYDYRKIIGVTAFASMVANTLIARHLRQDPARILCPLIGGCSPKGTIPVMSQTKPPTELNPEAYRKLTETIANVEEAILKKGGTICFAKSIAISRFINSLLKALKGDRNCVECGFVAQTGHIGDFLPFMTSIIKLGRNGVESTHMPKINETEVSQLRSSMPCIIQNIMMGKKFVGGDLTDLLKFKSNPRCDRILKDRMSKAAKTSEKDKSKEQCSKEQCSKQQQAAA